MCRLTARLRSMAVAAGCTGQPLVSSTCLCHMSIAGWCARVGSGTPNSTRSCSTTLLVLSTTQQPTADCLLNLQCKHSIAQRSMSYQTLPTTHSPSTAHVQGVCTLSGGSCWLFCQLHQASYATLSRARVRSSLQPAVRRCLLPLAWPRRQFRLCPPSLTSSAAAADKKKPPTKTSRTVTAPPYDAGHHVST